MRSNYGDGGTQLTVMQSVAPEPYDSTSVPPDPLEGVDNSAPSSQAVLRNVLCSGTRAYAERHQASMLERYALLTDPNRPKFGLEVELAGVRYDSHLEAAYALIGSDHGWNMNYEQIETNGSRPDFIRGIPYPDLIEIKGESQGRDLLKYIPKMQQAGWKGRAMILGDFAEPLNNNTWVIGIGADCCQWASEHWSRAIVFSCKSCGKFDLAIEGPQGVPFDCHRCQNQSKRHFASPYNWEQAMRVAKYTIARIADEQERANMMQEVCYTDLGTQETDHTQSFS